MNASGTERGMDSSVMTEALEHVPEPIAFTEASRCLLKPGGVLRQMAYRVGLALELYDFTSFNAGSANGAKPRQPVSRAKLSNEGRPIAAARPRGLGAKIRKAIEVLGGEPAVHFATSAVRLQQRLSRSGEWIISVLRVPRPWASC